MKRSKTTAGLLALFLGGLGIHKFYLGQHQWGVLYLLFCWTGIPSILGIFEGISYFSHSDEWWNEKYNAKSKEELYDEMLKYDSLKEKGLITEGEYKQKIAECKTKIENMEKKAKEQENEGKVKDEAKKNKEKKGGIGKLGIGAIIAFGVLLAIVVLWLFIAGRNTREGYSYEPPKPEVNIVELSNEDKDTCINWLEEHLGKEVNVLEIHAEEGELSGTLSVVGRFQTDDYLYFNTDFSCLKDVTGEIGMNGAGMIGLYISNNLMDVEYGLKDTDEEDVDGLNVLPPL